MQDRFAQGLLQNGIIEAKDGNKGAARRYLERVTMSTNDPDLLAEAWFWISQISDDPQEKRQALEAALSNDMQHARSRRELAILNGKLQPEEIVNPDFLPAQSEEPSQASADRFVCPKCGGRMSYAPDGRALICEYCTRQENLVVRKDQADEKDFFVAMATARGHRMPVAAQVFHCQGCGAEFILPPEQISATCAYCASPHVVSLEETRELLPPDGIIPHGFNQRRAAYHLVKWVEKHGITPQGQVQAPRGLYLPVWTFDVGGEVDYRGEIVEYEHNVLGQTERKVRRVKDSYAVLVDDLTIPASRKLARRVAALLPTYNLREIRPYDPRFLADWPAEIYDVAMGDAALEARSQAFTHYKKLLSSQLDHVTNLRMSSANLAIESFKLVLLPVWMTEIPLEGRQYLVLINGQNGQVRGETPKKQSPGLLAWLGDLFDNE